MAENQFVLPLPPLPTSFPAFPIPLPNQQAAQAFAAGADPLAAALGQALQFPGQLINSLGQGVGQMGSGIFGALGATVQSILMAPFNAMKGVAQGGTGAQAYMATPPPQGPSTTETGSGYFA